MRKRVVIGAKLLVSALLLGLLSRRLEFQQMGQVLAGVRMPFFLLALGLYLGGQLVSAYRWKTLVVPLELAVSYRRLVALYFLGMFFNFFFPTVVGGDAVKAYYLARETQQPVRALLSVFMDRNTGVCAMLVIALGAALLSGAHVADRALAVPLLGALIVYVVVNMVLFSESLYRVLVRLFEWGQLRPLVPLATRAHEALRAYRRSPASVLKAVGLSLLFHLCLISLNYANARAVGVTMDFLSFCVFIPLISAFSMIPISMYGIGVREYAFVLFFSQLGVRPETGLLLGLLWFAVTVFCSLPGVLIYVTYRRSDAVALARAHLPISFDLSSPQASEERSR